METPVLTPAINQTVMKTECFPLLQVNKLLNPGSETSKIQTSQQLQQQQHLPETLLHRPQPAAAKTLDTLNQENAALKNKIEQLSIKVSFIGPSVSLSFYPCDTLLYFLTVSFFLISLVIKHRIKVQF